MIITTGATGRLGRAAVEHLLEHVPAAQVGVSVRDPGAAQDLAARGVRVRQGDFTDPASLAHAFEGATQVLLVSGPAGAEAHRAAIDAAVAAGAQQIVYTSHMAAGALPEPLFAPAVGHARTERDLRDSGVRWTALRNGFHTSSALQIAGDALRTGELRAPADGPVCWTTQEDLAVAAVAALTEPDRFDGPTPPLTAGRLLDLDDVAGVLSALTGRRITRTTVSDEEHARDLVARGTPEAYVPLLMSYFSAARRGDFATTDPTLADLLGRTPTGVHDALTAQLSDAGTGSTSP